MSKDILLKKINFRSSEGILLLVVIFLCIVLSLISDRFLTADNAVNIIRQMSFNGILAIGMAFVIIGAGIDLSVGAIAAFTGVIFGFLSTTYNIPWGIALIAALMAGTLLGALNGVISAYLKIPSFIVTLGVQSLLRGVAMITTDGSPISRLNEGFIFIGMGSFLGVPIPIIIFVSLFIIAWICLNKTKLGRYVYASGDNSEAASVSGINVKRVSMITFAISGFMAAVFGLVQSARLMTVPPNLGIGAEMDAIAAVCVGGVSLYGGGGSLIGVLIGVAMMSIIRNGLTMLGISVWWQQVIVGAILIIAVFFSTRSSKSRG